MADLPTGPLRVRVTRRRLALGFGVAVLSLAGVAALSYVTTRRLVASSNRVSRTYEVLRRVDQLRVEVLAGPGRGPWPAERELRVLTADRPSQQARLDRLAGLRASGAPLGPAAVHGLLTEMAGEEEALLRERVLESDATERREYGLMAAGSLIGIGVVVLAFASARRDVLRRADLERERDRERNRLQAVLDGASGTSIISADPRGTITLFSAGAERMLGWRAEELVGKATPEIFHLADEVAARGLELSRRLERPVEGFDVFVENVRAGGIEEREWTYVRKDGSRLTVSLSVGALRGPDGAVTGFVGVASDISERKRVEKMKSDFISTVSHELRTPITSIRGSLGLIATSRIGELPEPVRQLVQVAHRNSERLVRIINDILDIEKMESGKMAFELRTLDLGALVAQAVEANAGIAADHGVTFVVEPPPEALRVKVDPDRMMQVMGNLLSNAAKFGGAGSSVRIRVEARDAAARIEVADRGCGIPASFQSRIFQKFAQADASDQRSKGGTGLGLSICRTIVERHGGQIGFTSEEGKGATFYVDLPLYRGSEDRLARLA